MWQADTFDPKRIDLELGWAAGLGMNTMRVFLHDLLWQQDAEGLQAAPRHVPRRSPRKHGIRPMFVLFDSVWDPNPQLGKQRAPRPGVHNSGWVQSPEPKALQDPAEHARLEAYVKGVVGAFARDERVLAWDIWNEPDNLNTSSYGKLEPTNKVDLVLALLPKTFAWARAANPTAAPDGRGVEGRLVEPGEDDGDGSPADRALRRRHVPQLRLAHRSSSGGSTG